MSSWGSANPSVISLPRVIFMLLWLWAIYDGDKNKVFIFFQDAAGGTINLHLRGMRHVSLGDKGNIKLLIHWDLPQWKLKKEQWVIVTAS